MVIDFYRFYVGYKYGMSRMINQSLFAFPLLSEKTISLESFPRLRHNPGSGGETGKVMPVGLIISFTLRREN